MEENAKKAPEFYNAIAKEYAVKNYDELDHKPLDRYLLCRFADLVRGKGKVYDIGCGPGEIACFLKQYDVDMAGIDISIGMVEEARRLNPTIKFEVGDMFQLNHQDNSLAGISAFYAVVHFTLEEVRYVLKEFYRVLQPGGYLILAFHAEEQVIHVDEMYGKPLSIDYIFFDAHKVLEHIKDIGFQIEEALVREPYKNVEYASRRAYIIVKKPL